MESGGEGGRQVEEGGLSGLIGPRGPEGLRLQWSPKLKPGCGRSLSRLWRRTFGWPRGGSGKLTRQTDQEGNAGLSSGCFQQGRRTTDLD